MRLTLRIDAERSSCAYNGSQMVLLSRELDTATQQAVDGLRGFGYSWAEIAARLGTTRQATQQRWGR